ncbi:MAG: transposase [Desulfosoma sp.]
MADPMRSIFYASSKDKAGELFLEFKTQWEKDLPSAVACLEKGLESCLTFFNFPEEEWISLRTTNIIERLNKEFRWRTRPMEILAGERSCYTLLAFIALKMEVHWSSNPLEKVRKNLQYGNGSKAEILHKMLDTTRKTLEGHTSMAPKARWSDFDLALGREDIRANVIEV